MAVFVVAGIDTDVGKTLVSAIVTEALDGCYWKPVQCGPAADRRWVEEHLSKKERCYPERYQLQAPCSPHQAARMEQLKIDADALLLPSCSRHLIIEGCGGILTPLNETESWIDAAIHWKAYWILVHRHYLGSLNHYLLSIACLKQRKMNLLGVVFNGAGDFETEKMLLRRAKTICLGRLPWIEQFTSEMIQHWVKEWRPALQSALGRQGIKGPSGTHSPKRKRHPHPSQS